MITKDQIETIRSKFQKDTTSAPQTAAGMLDVGRYLDRYGVAFKVKPNGSATLYVLEKCLFDSGHGRGEASIVQTGEGKVIYQCFHDSCKGRTWYEAREMVSGKDSLADFLPKSPARVEPATNHQASEAPKAPFVTPASILQSKDSTGSRADILEGMIPENALVLLSGPPASMKTFIVMSLGIARATNASFLSRKVLPGAIYYFDKENPQRIWVERLEMLTATEITDNFFVWPYWTDPEPMTFPAGQNTVHAYYKLARNNKGALFVFDSLVRFLPHGADENSASDIAPVMSFLRSLTAHVTVIVLHHKGKDGGSEYRGSSDFLASVDLGYSISKAGNRLTLRCIKNRFGKEEDFSIELKESAEGYLFFEDVSSADQLRRKEEYIALMRRLQNIILALANSDGGATQGRIIDQAREELRVGKPKVLDLLARGMTEYWTLVEVPGHRKVYAASAGYIPPDDSANTILLSHDQTEDTPQRDSENMNRPKGAASGPSIGTLRSDDVHEEDMYLHHDQPPIGGADGDNTSEDVFVPEVEGDRWQS